MFGGGGGVGGGGCGSRERERAGAERERAHRDLDETVRRTEWNFFFFNLEQEKSVLRRPAHANHFSLNEKEGFQQNKQVSNPVFSLTFYFQPKN